MLAIVLPDQAVNFGKQARELQYTPPLIGPDIFADTTFSKKIAPYLSKVAYVYCAVEPEFINHVQKELGDSSYFFEVASGYTLGEFACKLADLSEEERSKPLSDVLKQIKLSKTPIKGLSLVQDDDYGLHYDTGVEIYDVSRNKK